MEKKLNILSVNTSDSSGGAARAAYRIHTGVRSLGVNSRVFVKEKLSNDNTVVSLDEFEPKNIFQSVLVYIQNKIKNKIQHYHWNKYPNREDVFMSDLRSVPLNGALQKIDYNVLHLHWVNLRFLDIRELKKIKTPIVWTLHDNWAFAGICHVFNSCDRYKLSCGDCPLLHSGYKNDLSHKIWLQKAKAYQSLDLHIVTPSNWLADCAKESSLFKRFPITVIPNGLDTDRYKPQSKDEACQFWGLNTNKKKILFGAMNGVKDKNKGFKQLLDAISYIEKNIDCSTIELLVFGADKPIDEIQTIISIHYLGYLTQENELVAAYNAADVMVVPSLQEVFGQTASEAMSCGVPTVAFNCTGIKEVIDHKQTGYLAEAYNTVDLGRGIIWCIENNKDNHLSFLARKKVLDNYTIKKVSEKYIELYTKL